MSIEYDYSANTFGLPQSLWIPIAAKNLDTVEQHVGPIVSFIKGRSGILNAVLVQTVIPDSCDLDIPLWEDSKYEHFVEQLYPKMQVWVHVDYRNYRSAWIKFNQPILSKDIVLDHIANRKAVRMRGYIHPYIRLSPIMRCVNSNAGHSNGSEGLEKEYLMILQRKNNQEISSPSGKISSNVIYADPADLTKMINISPGVSTLDGVRDIQNIFYKRK